MRRIRDRQELEAAFQIQLRALHASAEAYDSGSRWEALRLATVVHTLVHDGGKKNVSLLTQLGIRGKMRFIASGYDINNSQNELQDTPLVIMRIGGGQDSYRPRLGDPPSEPPRWLQVSKWWESDLIYRSWGGKHRLTRKKLVFALRNQEGGSHFDAELKDPNYIEMVYGTTWQVGRADGSVIELRQLELASMRQIAWELGESIKRMESYGQT